MDEGGSEEKNYRIAVIGSRGYRGRAIIPNILQSTFGYFRQFGKPVFISGGCKNSPDQWGQQWAVRNNIPCIIFPAEWQKHGKKAGLVRNKKIVDNADYLIAFWDGKSHGTKYTIDLALQRGLPVITVNESGEIKNHTPEVSEMSDNNDRSEGS